MPVKKRGSKSSSKADKPSKKKSSAKEDKVSSKKSGKSSLRDRAKEQIKESKKKGFTAMREAKKEYSNNTKWMGFFVRKGETKPIIFLTEDLHTERVHNIKQVSRNGKEFYREVLCTGEDDCDLCVKAQEGNKAISAPRTAGVVLLLDVEGYEKDDKEIPFVIRPMTVNPTMASVLEHRDNKEGLYLTVYDMSKLDRGHSLDVVRDKKDKIQRFKDVKEIIKYVKDENEQTAKLLKEKLEEFGDLGDWLKEEIVPEFLDPAQVNLSDTESGSDDGEEEESYSFRKGRRGGKDKTSSKDKGSKRRSRLR